MEHGPSEELHKLCLSGYLQLFRPSIEGHSFITHPYRPTPACPVECTSTHHLVHVGELVVPPVRHILHGCPLARALLELSSIDLPFSPSPPSLPYVSYWESMLVSRILAGLPAATRCRSRCLFNTQSNPKQMILMPMKAENTPRALRRPGRYRGASEAENCSGPVR
jgi:hypothetical protein